MSDTSMQGKVALVTGATNGIGKVAATALASKGAEVVIVGRDRAKTDTVLQEIQSQSGNANVSALLGDLSRVSEVRRVAAEFRAKHDKLHVLLNNAGALFHDREVTAEGFERTFALNHLAYFVLTNELLDLLKASAPARIVSVASEAHRVPPLDFDDLQHERGYVRFKVYGRSKQANILFTRELARRLEGTGVTANCLHPGVVATSFGSGKGFVASLINLAKPFMITPEKGADTAVWLATSPEVAGVSGKYFAKRKERTPAPIGVDDAAAKRLWEETEKLVSRANASSAA